MQTPCWISQSLPAIVAAINSGLCKTKRLHVSSLYRLLRGESLSMIHKNHLLAVFKRADVEQLNEHMRKFPSCKFVMKDVTSWKARRDDGEKSARPQDREGSGRTWTDPRRDPSGLRPLLQTSQNISAQTPTQNPKWWLQGRFWRGCRGNTVKTQVAT